MSICHFRNEISTYKSQFCFKRKSCSVKRCIYVISTFETVFWSHDDKLMNDSTQSVQIVQGVPFLTLSINRLILRKAVARFCGWECFVLPLTSTPLKILEFSTSKITFGNFSKIQPFLRKMAFYDQNHQKIWNLMINNLRNWKHLHHKKNTLESYTKFINWGKLQTWQKTYCLLWCLPKCFVKK